MKVPISEAIDSGAWLKCVTDTHDGEFVFQFRALSFNKVLPDAIDEPHKIISVINEGVLWLLKIEVINLSKEPFNGYHVQSSIVLLDQDNFTFDALYDSHLQLCKFGESVGIKRFSGWSDVPKLNPKTKVIGAVPFLLPDSDEAVYSLSVRSGNIEEV